MIKVQRQDVEPGKMFYGCDAGTVLCPCMALHPEVEGLIKGDRFPSAERGEVLWHACHDGTLSWYRSRSLVYIDS